MLSLVLLLVFWRMLKNCEGTKTLLNVWRAYKHASASWRPQHHVAYVFCHYLIWKLKIHLYQRKNSWWESCSLIPVGLEILNPETPGQGSRACWSLFLILAFKRNVFRLLPSCEVTFLECTCVSEALKSVKNASLRHYSLMFLMFKIPARTQTVPSNTCYFGISIVIQNGGAML